MGVAARRRGPQRRGPCGPPVGFRGRPGGSVARVRSWIPRRERPVDREAFWVAWSRRVMARPWLSAGGAAGILLFLAIPLLSLETGTNAIQQFPKDRDVRVGNELA